MRKKKSSTKLVSVGYFMNNPLFMMIENPENPVVNNCRDFIEKSFKLDDFIEDFKDILKD